jgi:multiple sugar transport system ATP-binding protein
VAALAEGARVIFGIRPEAVSDLDGADAKSNSITTFTGQVEIVEPAGSDTFVVTSIAGKEVTARMRADSDIRVGQSHVFALNLDKAVLFDPATTRRL